MKSQKTSIFTWREWGLSKCLPVSKVKMDSRSKRGSWRPKYCRGSPSYYSSLQIFCHWPREKTAQPIWLKFSGQIPCINISRITEPDFWFLALKRGDNSKRKNLWTAISQKLFELEFFSKFFLKAHVKLYNFCVVTNFGRYDSFSVKFENSKNRWKF